MNELFTDDLICSTFMHENGESVTFKFNSRYYDLKSPCSQ